MLLGKTWSEIFKIDNISEIKEKLIEWYPKDYIKLKKIGILIKKSQI